MKRSNIDQRSYSAHAHRITHVHVQPRLCQLVVGNGRYVAVFQLMGSTKTQQSTVTKVPVGCEEQVIDVDCMAPDPSPLVIGLAPRLMVCALLSSIVAKINVKKPKNKS